MTAPSGILLRLCLCSLLIPLARAGADGAPAQPAPVISACDKPFAFGFLGWEKAKTAFASLPDGLHITAENGKGGAGLIAGGSLSLAGYGEWSPAIRVASAGRNTATSLKLVLQDRDGTKQTYSFNLAGLVAGAAREVVAEQGASLAEPEKTDEPGQAPGLDVTNITTVMIVGDWGNGPVDLVLSGVSLAEPTEAIRAQRAVLKAARAREAEQARQAAEAREAARREYLSTGAPHPADGPTVTRVCAVAPDILSVTLQAGTFSPNSLTPYVAQPDDKIVAEDKGKPRYIVKDGKVVEDFDKSLSRVVNGKQSKVGALSPDGLFLFKEGVTAGQQLDETVVDAPAAYAIQSADDPAYAQPTPPAKVFRKGKPNGYSRPLPFAYTISLQLPSPLKEGAAYAIRFIGVNTAQERVTYVHRPRETPSDAVHAIQTGYRPDDPFKRAYLSIWLGGAESGEKGGYTHAAGAFELIDTATGKAVFTGTPELTKALDAKERLNVHDEKDFTLTAVHRLDFSEFTAPGEYRVYVPGIGVSGAFRVAADVWDQPFKTAMQGIVAQRQGIELGPPVCNFRSPRAFHPDDGVEFYQMSITVQEGQEGERGADLKKLADAGKLERVTGVWGGYQDAGDWDTLGHHLSLTYQLLELYELAPEHFARVKLSLPAEEQANTLPDLLDEALWQVPCFLRLQLPDGGVRGGYGEGWGCRRAQTSDRVRSAGVYAPDHVTSMHYAACAAKAARVLKPFDAKRAGEYLESARRAWAWAESHANDADPTYARLKVRKGWPPFLPSLKNARAAAAVELFAATRDPAFHAAFTNATELVKTGSLRYLDQPDADFAYARLPADLGDPALKQRAIDVTTAYADYAIEFSHQNAFEIINGRRTDVPVVAALTYFAAPAVQGYAFVRAYVLTGKPAYLAAAVQGCNYSLGANPDNLSYCPGIGHTFVRFPFKVDAAVTGQYPDVPAGYIPYGQGDETNPMCKAANGWAYQWLLNYGPLKKMVPDFYTWPVNEMYIDFGIVPQMNENTVDSTTLAAAYYWGFLGARK